MAKLLLFLLMLALVAGGAAAADDSDLLERQENMAEVIRMSADVASADPETMHRASAFMRRELGPFGVVFNAIAKLPENSAADVRMKADAQEAAEELLVRHQRQLLFGNGNGNGNAKITGACRKSGRCP